MIRYTMPVPSLVDEMLGVYNGALDLNRTLILRAFAAHREMAREEIRWLLMLPKEWL